MNLHRCMNFGQPRGAIYRSFWRIAAVWIGCIVGICSLTSYLGAQENATINGTVNDSSGAVVSNAQLSLTNTNTGQELKTVSNSAGAYRFANLAYATYTLTATAPGFQTFTKTGIVVNVGQTVEADVVLTVGSQAQTVTVQANALQVQTETSEVSNLISGQQVEQLSTNGRNVTQLAALGLGVSNTLSQFGGIDALTSSNGISFNGTRSTHNIYLLDGAEQNDRGCGGCFMNLPSQDAIAEFQTLDSNYSPDYGIGSGGTILMVLKSGTKQFHGELYEFNRNQDYNANDYFTKRAHQPTPKFQLNEPGGNIGGPLFIPHVYNTNRTRTFFFWNEEWRRLVQGGSPSVNNTILNSNFPTAGADLAYTEPSSSVTPIVPTTTDSAKLALYAQDGLVAGQPFPKNADGTYRIPANLIDPNSVLLLNAGTFPHPNLGTSQYTASIPAHENIREDTVRIDHTISSKYQLMGHYLHDAMARQFFPPLWGDSTYPTVGTQMANPSYTAAIKLTQTYSPSLLNETGFFYGGNKIQLTPIANSGFSFTIPSGWTATSFFPLANNRMTRLPEVQLQGSPLNTTWSPSYFPWKNGYEGFEYRDDLTWTKGRHQMKFGFSWLHDYKNQELQANTNGTAVFNSSVFSKDSYINFLLGDASNFSQLEYLAGKHWVNNNYGFYANDNFHVNPSLTLNLGIRFDGLPHAFERYDRFANFVTADYDSSLGNPVDAKTGTLSPASLSTFSATGNEPFYLNGIREAGVNGFPRGNVQNYYHTWQPRIGFAWNVRNDGKTVLRGGFGMFYERVQGNDVYNAALNPPFAYIPSADNVYFSNPHTDATTGLTTAQAFPSNLTNIKYHYPPPGTANYSLGLQREVAPSVVAVLQYVGSDGWDQNNDRQINTLPLVGDPNVPASENPYPGTPYGFREGVAKGQLKTNRYRNFPGFGNINQEENETHFNYNSLQAGIRIENRHGLTTQLAYTWSHEIDQATNDLNGLSNPYNPNYDRGSGGFDRRHIFNASYVYALPIYRNGGNAFERTVVGGWSISGITQIQTGVPIFIHYTGSDTVGLGGGTTNRPNLVAKVGYPKTVNAWFTKNSFADPVAPWDGGPGGVNAGFGNAGRDAVVGPGLFNWNLSLFKTIRLTEEAGPSFELRFESFNTFNHTQWSGVNANNHDSNFGQVTSDYGPRVLELGGKFKF
jgi:hypothetical protein